jgi:hypothetical protein
MAVSFDRGRVHDSAELLREKRLGLTPPVSARGWAPVDAEMAEVLATPPDDIAGVLIRLTRVQEILDSLPPTPAASRVACFNSLYHTITDRVASSLRGPEVTDPEFLELLDVEFAKRYFDALRLWGMEDDTTPDVWEVLFRRAHDKRVSALAAAMLGVNAHINHDLAIALIATWVELGPPTDGLIHPDYLLINQIFYEEIPPLRRRFANRLQMRLDALVGDLDDWSQEVLVTATRSRAWNQAERMWLLRHDPDDFAQAMLTMDRAAAFIGEALIVGDSLTTRLGTFAISIRTTYRGAARRLYRRRAVTSGIPGNPDQP